MGRRRLALSNKHYQTMEVLLAHGADPDTMTAESKTLLYASVAS